jgi:hypothetical protein
MSSSRDSPIRPFWWTKRLTAAFIVAAALLMAMRIAWGYHMAARLEARKAWLRERGVVIDAKLLEQPIVSAERNQIAGLLQATAWIDFRFEYGEPVVSWRSWPRLATVPRASTIGRAMLAEAMRRPDRSWRVALPNGFDEPDAILLCEGLAQQLALDAHSASASEAIHLLEEASWIIDALNERAPANGMWKRSDQWITAAVGARAGDSVRADDLARWRHLMLDLQRRVSSDESQRREVQLQATWASVTKLQDVMFSLSRSPTLAPLENARRESLLLNVYHSTTGRQPTDEDAAWARRLSGLGIPSIYDLQGWTMHEVQERASEDDARQRAVVLIAVMLYRADHAGDFPASVDELVPQYLASVPRLSDGSTPPLISMATSQPTTTAP